MTIIRAKITDVFTPRDKDVNAEMYVERPELEKALFRSISGSLHSLLFGESGNGKSWLYKHVFSQKEIKYVVANCSNASRLKSVTEEIFNACVPSNHAEKTSFEEGKEAKANAIFAEGTLKHNVSYELKGEEKLQKAFRLLSESNGNQLSVIVLDNLESIFDNLELLKELANIILLLDDERYGIYKIKFLIVGIPNGVLEFFSKTLNLESVANRIEELPKVRGLTVDEVNKFINLGFCTKLKVKISDNDIIKLSRHIHNVTIGVAQRVHEYCTSLAYVIEDADWIYDSKQLESADRNWLIQGLRASYTVVESHMNSKETTVGRRNQVIYAISKVTSHQFHSGNIEEIIHKEFPSTVPETNMGLGAILNELCRSEKPLIQKSGNTSSFMIKDPRYIMCIRIMLFKNKEKTRVQKISFSL